MAQTKHALDPFRSLVDEGVADAELAKMADVSVTEVRKYKARIKAQAKKDAEVEAKVAEETEDAIAAKAKGAVAEKPPEAPKPASPAPAARPVGDLVQQAQALVEKHPGKLVVRLTRGFGVRVTSPRSGKQTSHPVQRSDYKGGMAVQVVKLCVGHGHEDAIVLMDPDAADYPPPSPEV